MHRLPPSCRTYIPLQSTPKASYKGRTHDTSDSSLFTTGSVLQEAYLLIIYNVAHAFLFRSICKNGQLSRLISSDSLAFSGNYTSVADF